MTSNAGAQSLMQPKQLGFLNGEDEKRDYDFMKQRVLEDIKKIFKPEFLNRIDETIVFHPLSLDNMKKILQIQIGILASRCKEQFDLRLNFTSAANRELVKASFDSKYGARPLRRAIQTLIEDPLSEKLILGEIKTGDDVRIGFKNGKYTFDLLTKRSE